MSNPVKNIIKENKSFTYFHTHVITEEILEAALSAGASLEVDIAVDNEGQLYIGHPLEYYDFFGMERPQNLPLDYVLDQIYKAGLFLAIDCKNIKALPKIRQIIKRFGADHCQFHAWADELLFKPYPSEFIHEPHWRHEDLPTREIVQLREETSVAVVMAVRGLNQERLRKAGEMIVDKIIRVAKGKADSVYFYLPYGEVPPMECMERLLDNGLVTYFSIDRVPEAKRPRLYHGMTDRLERATRFVRTRDVRTTLTGAGALAERG